MASLHGRVKRKAVDTSGSVTPTDSAYPHERSDVESAASKNGFGGPDEKYSQFHEISLSPQSSSLEGASEDRTENKKLSRLYAKYKIFFHAFLWLLFTG
jgi:hypothetical protein